MVFFTGDYSSVFFDLHLLYTPTPFGSYVVAFFVSATLVIFWRVIYTEIKE